MKHDLGRDKRKCISQISASRIDEERDVMQAADADKAKGHVFDAVLVMSAFTFSAH